MVFILSFQLNRLTVYDYSTFTIGISTARRAEFIDDQTDWSRFTNRLQDLQQLNLVDDRHIVNPLMTDYDRTTKSRYALAPAAVDCHCAVTRPYLLDQ